MTDYPTGCVYRNNQECYIKTDWGWKFVGIAEIGIFPEKFINYDHEKDIIDEEK